MNNMILDFNNYVLCFHCRKAVSIKKIWSVYGTKCPKCGATDSFFPPRKQKKEECKVLNFKLKGETI